MVDIEEWRAVVGFEGLYEISSHGRVRSLYRPGSTGRMIPSRMLKLSLSNSGYLFVGMRDKDHAFKVARIHTLVARAFIGERPKGLVINHIDFDKTNNHVSNLEYVTTLENIHHSARQARHTGAFTMEQVQAIRSLVSRDPAADLDMLADKLGVDLLTIRNLLNAVTYSLVPNKDGSMPTPIPFVHNRPLVVEDVADLMALGFTIPQISKYYGVEYSTPYQMLRRAGIWQDKGTRGTGRLASKSKALQAQQESA